MKIIDYIGLALFFVFLIVVTWQDIETKKIKNEFCMTGVALGVTFAVLSPNRTILSALLGFFALLLVGFVSWTLKVFRAGDAKLFSAIGAFFGWKMGLNIFLISVLCGAVIGIPLVIRRLIRKEKGWTQFPFSIAISLACVLGICFGYIWDWFI